MTRTTPTEHLLLSSGGDTVKRGLVVGTRAAQWQAVVSAIHQDADTNGIYSLDLTSVTGGNDPTDSYPGMTLDIGTSAGLRDVGMVRIRFYGSDSNTVTIAETAPADLPVEVGHFVTARLEYLPWQIPKRIVYTRVAGVITAVTEYLDYDLVYPGGSDPFPPKGNITAGHNADGSLKHVEPFGWLDAGQTYRTVHLSALDSVVHNVGATLGTVLWFIEGGVIVTPGVLTDTEIDVQFQLGFHTIHLLVADSAGAGDNFYRHMPIWVDDPDNPTMVLRNFNVTSDETELGREMQFEFFGDANEADETVIPEKSLVCYFEEPTWADGDTPPESYRTQVLGWVTDDDPLLKLQESKYGIKVGGTQVWKSRFRANSIGLIDTGSTPTTYTEMQHITVDRAIDFSLRATDTLRSLANVYYTRVTTKVEALTLPQGDAWTQVSEAVPYAAMSAAGCDSFGNIWMRKLYSFLSAGQRLTVLEAISLTNADWTDQDGLDLPTTKINKVGMVVGSAEYWNSGRVLYASQAPGLRSGYGVGLPKLPDQYVDPPTPQGDLNRLTGLFYWHENNPRPTVTLILLGNLDVIEPCWQQPILITWAADTIRGITFDNTPFVVKHVSVSHTNSPDESAPPKRITLTLEQATDGESGETAPVIQMDGMSQYEDTTCDVTAGFSSSVDVCLVTFTDTSTGDLLYDWKWDFGDGSVSIEQNPVHGYSEAGTYTVTLTVSNECGSSDPVSHNVIVDAESVAADVSVSIDGLTVTFTDGSSTDSGILSWAWEFGDGATSDQQNPEHTYADTIEYDWSLTITTECGVTATTEGTVNLAPFRADFYYDVGSSFDARFLDRSVTPGTSITSWAWIFGDAGTSTSQNPSHTYAGAGSYSVTLTIHTADARTASVTKTISTMYSYWVHNSDFTDLDTLADGWLVMDSQGTFSAGVGFIASGSDEPRIFRNFPFTTILYKWETYFHHDHVAGSATQTTNDTKQTVTTPVVDGVYNWLADYHEQFTAVFAYTHSVDDFSQTVGWGLTPIQAVVDYNRTSGLGRNTITKIIQWGRGHDPYEV